MRSSLVDSARYHNDYIHKVNDRTYRLLDQHDASGTIRLRATTHVGTRQKGVLHMTKPLLVPISGVSGSGKSTLIHKLVAHYGGGRVVTYTSRPPRAGETPDSYHFRSQADIRSLPDTVWVKENYGHLYAVTKASLREPLKQFGIAFLPTTTSHQVVLQTLLPGVRYFGIHLRAPHVDELRRRMAKRGDDEKKMRARLRTIDSVERKAWQTPGLLLLPPMSAEETFRVVHNLIDAERQ